jgi:hypothetical protein
MGSILFIKFIESGKLLEQKEIDKLTSKGDYKETIERLVGILFGGSLQYLSICFFIPFRLKFYYFQNFYCY